MAFGDMTIVQDASKHVRKYLNLRPEVGRVNRTPVMRVETRLLAFDYLIVRGQWGYQRVADPEFPVDLAHTSLFPSTSANARLTVFIAFQLAVSAKGVLAPSDPLEQVVADAWEDPEYATDTWHGAVSYLHAAAQGQSFTIGAARNEAARYLAHLTGQ